MTSRWTQRAWKGALFVGLLGATWIFLAPDVPTAAGGIPFMDKLAHVGIFATLALVGARAYAEKPRWGIAAALLFYGVCIEIAQPRTGRAFDLLDIAADAVGCAAIFLVREQRSSWASASEKR